MILFYFSLNTFPISMPGRRSYPDHHVQEPSQVHCEFYLMRQRLRPDHRRGAATMIFSQDIKYPEVCCPNGPQGPHAISGYWLNIIVCHAAVPLPALPFNVSQVEIIKRPCAKNVKPFVYAIPGHFATCPDYGMAMLNINHI